MSKQIQDAYIVAAVRTPVGKAPRGMFRNVRPDDMLAHVLRGAVAQVPGLDPHDIGDVIVGCAMPEAEQGMNVARIGVLLAGLPDSVPAMTINRFCSSGVQAVALAADRIRTGDDDVVIAAGTESMSMVPMMGNKIALNDAVFTKDENVAIAYGMGITAENVARQWKVSREDQDAFRRGEPPEGGQGDRRGRFQGRDPGLRGGVGLARPRHRQVVRRKKVADTDEGPRPDSSMEGLAKLKTVFAAKGSVTAGNSSQMSDGAAAVILMSEKASRNTT
jgi:acetyl-CoA acyltransferase